MFQRRPHASSNRSTSRSIDPPGDDGYKAKATTTNTNNDNDNNNNNNKDDHDGTPMLLLPSHHNHSVHNGSSIDSSKSKKQMTTTTTTRTHRKISSRALFLVLAVLLCGGEILGTWWALKDNYWQHHGGSILHHHPPSSSSSWSSSFSQSQHNPYQEALPPSSTKSNHHGPILRDSSGQKQNRVQQQQQQQYSQQHAKTFQLTSPAAPACHPLASPDEITVTLVTQVSHDRLWMLEQHCARYPHRIALAVYTNATSREIVQELQALGCSCSTTPHNTMTLRRHSSSSSRSRSKTPHDPDPAQHPTAWVDVAILDAQVHGAWNDYPVNALRNLALQQVQTTHILYIDVDFWTSEDMYETILGEEAELRSSSSSSQNRGARQPKAVLTNASLPSTPVLSHSILSSAARIALFNDPKQALVIPAFQLWRQCKAFKDCRTANLKYMERTLTGLAEGIKKKRITMFDPTNFGGHGSTEYSTWFQQSSVGIVGTKNGGSVYDLPCIKSNRYEPYVMVRYCDNLPPFQPVFAGYGKNKVTWMMQLLASGYVLSQVSGAYLLHYPHLDSSSRRHWNGKKKTTQPPPKNHHDNNNNKSLEDVKRGQIDTLYWNFKTWLKHTIPSNQRRLHLCEDAQDDDTKLLIDPHLRKGQK